MSLLAARRHAPSAAAVVSATAQGAARRLRDSRFGRAVVERRIRRGAMLAIGLAVSGPILVLLTYAALSSADEQSASSWWLRFLLLADVVYVVGLFALIGMQVARLVVARRARTAGSKLHARMVAVFTGVAAAPAIIVAIVFFLVIQLGFEAWFSEQVGSVVRNSRDVAAAYAKEHEQAIGGEAITLATDLSDVARDLVGGPAHPRFQQHLARVSEDSAFSDIYILNSSATIIGRGSNSFLFSFSPPTIEEITSAQSGRIVIKADDEAEELRALVRLQGVFDAYLYVTRPIDGDVLKSLRQTKKSVVIYNYWEQNRDVWMARFAALYLGFVVLVLAAAIYLGLWFAERLAKPIGRLAAAAQRVRSGELGVRVKEERGQDEIALLSRVFNRMTEEVERKREELTRAHRESEDRRRFSETVLAGVTPGVLGLDSDGRLQLMNDSAAELLSLEPDEARGRGFAELAPEFGALLEDAKLEPAKGVEKPIRLNRNGESRELLARVTTQRGDGVAVVGVAGYVVTLDDLTALVAAERLAAWGDVARRVAHEIKNPLTPIQLAAERMKRKYSDRLGEDSNSFNDYVETIVRQTADIGRMVDAFVRFAKLPTPKMSRETASSLIREAAPLQEQARPHIRYVQNIEPDVGATEIRCDRGQILQTLTNLLQNAADAIDGRLENEQAEGVEGPSPEIRITLRLDGAGGVKFEIEDNGVGLPAENRDRLLEPYVTTRAKGTGLGLAIVQKIIEEHGGYFALTDATPFSEGAQPGAMARLTLPKAPLERKDDGSRAERAAMSRADEAARGERGSGEVEPVIE